MLYLPGQDSDFVENLTDDEVEDFIKAVDLAAYANHQSRESGVAPGDYGGSSVGTVFVNALLEDLEDDSEVDTSYGSNR